MIIENFYFHRSCGLLAPPKIRFMKVESSPIAFTLNIYLKRKPILFLFHVEDF